MTKRLVHPDSKVESCVTTRLDWKEALGPSVPRVCDDGDLRSRDPTPSGRDDPLSRSCTTRQHDVGGTTSTFLGPCVVGTFRCPQPPATRDGTGSSVRAPQFQDRPRLNPFLLRPSKRVGLGRRVGTRVDLHRSRPYNAVGPRDVGGGKWRCKTENRKWRFSRPRCGRGVGRTDWTGLGVGLPRV